MKKAKGSTKKPSPTKANTKTKAKKVKASRGASAQGQGWGFVLPTISLRVLVFCGLLSSIAALSYFGYMALNTAAQRPIQSVAIEGDFKYVSQEAVADLLNPIIVDGFLQLPLMKVKEKLEAHAWIAQVNVSRRWPDTLFIAITEQTPIARWGEVGFLNHHGEVILVEQTPVLAPLPWLDGSSEDAKLLMQRYQQFTQLLRPHGLKVVTFQADATNDLTVILDNGLSLYMGKDEVMEKFQRFVLVLQHSLKNRLQEVAAVDLRYNNGLAVQWQVSESGENINQVVADNGIVVR